MTLPEPRRSPFYEAEWLGILLVHLAAAWAAIAVPGMEWAGQQMQPARAWGMPAWPGVGLFLAGALVEVFAKRSDRKRDVKKREGTEELQACVHTLHAAILGWKGLSYEAPHLEAVRITVHKVKDKREVEQLIDYVGGPADCGAAGRTFARNGGVVGAALLLKRSAADAVRPDGMSDDDYRTEMMRDHRIPPHEAKELRTDRQFFLAVPILSGKDEPVGVVYLDTARRDFLDKRDVDGIVNACSGIARYLQSRYEGGS